ncbi:MAG: electron transport complex subunit RsxC [Clostridia bacterium]|nr:electron transport complex subunit RsxC [Clostridia bacterium]
MPLFKLGSLHVPHKKNTASMAAVRMSPPESVLIPVTQHIGAPAAITVKPGDEVYVGTLIATASGFVSAPIHSSVSGKVKKIEDFLTPQGKTVPAVLIESDGNMTPDPTLRAPKIESADDLINAVRESGLVGLGGAGFPTAVKLEAQKKGNIDRIILNGAECEPYITADTRTMLDDAELVREGVELLLRFLKVDEVIIGIEANKAECIERMSELFASNPSVRVERLPSAYPQGAEKMLVYNTTGRVIPEGKLPADVGCIVMNVTSVAFLAKYARTGIPLVEKCVTVDGSAVKSPANVIAPVGASIESVIAFTGGYAEPAAKILYGGPMMGVAVYSSDYPIMKNTNAIVAMGEREAKIKPTIPCIHCGRCVAICPMGLNPTAYAKAMNVDDHTDRAERLTAAKINLCIECGSCSYVCPSGRPLVETNRLAKTELREYMANQKKGDK